MAGKMSVNVSIFSADGFNVNRVEHRNFVGLLTKRVMLHRASKKICVAASDKFGKQECFHFYDWEEIDVLITDNGLPNTAVKAIEARGVAVRLVERVPKLPLV